MALYHCTALTDITCLSTVPPKGLSTTKTHIRLHVPAGCGSAYSTVEEFREIYHFEILEDAPAEDDTPIILNDGEVFSNAAKKEDVSITYNRNFSGTDWRPLFIPFEISYADWKNDFDVARLNAFYEFTDDGQSRQKVEFIYIQDEDAVLKANHPYLIRAKVAGEKSITIEHATLFTSDPSTFDDLKCATVETNFSIKGTYQDNESLKDKYYMANGALYLDQEGKYNSIPYRWFISTESKGAQYNHASPHAKGSTFEIVVIGDSNPTGITEINVHTQPDGKMYTIDGRSINREPSKGTLYIKNGRKYIK